MTETEKLKQELKNNGFTGKLIIETDLEEFVWYIQVLGPFRELADMTKGGFEVLLQAKGNSELEAINKIRTLLQEKK